MVPGKTGPYLTLNSGNTKTWSGNQYSDPRRYPLPKPVAQRPAPRPLPRPAPRPIPKPLQRPAPIQRHYSDPSSSAYSQNPSFSQGIGHHSPNFPQGLSHHPPNFPQGTSNRPTLPALVMTDDGGGDWEVLSEVSEVETIKSCKASCMIQKLCISF